MEAETSAGPPSPRKRRSLLVPIAVAIVVLGALAAVGGKVAFEKTRPIAIAPLKTMPATWNVKPGTKIEDLSEYWVEYKLVGELQGKPGDQFHLVVQGPEPTPYMRILYGDELQKGGIIGLAVRKNGATYTAAVRGYDSEGNGPRYSNTLQFKF